jgi:hypothetical protein
MMTDLIAAVLSLPVLVGSTVTGPVEPAPPVQQQHAPYVSHMFNPHAVIDGSQVEDRTVQHAGL